MNKNEIYQQISKFNKSVIDEKDTKTSKHYYVQNNEALDMATFIKFLIETHKGVEQALKNLNTVVDLAFGSGSLTAYTLLENNLEFGTLYLNDKFEEDANTDLADDLRRLNAKSIVEVTDFDFFHPSYFTFIENVDLLIFNPTSGGQPQKKDYKNKKNGSIEQLKEAIARITYEKTFVIFVGSDADFKDIFSEYNGIFDYWISGVKTGKHLFVAQKTATPLSICYEKSENSFVIIPNCEKSTTNAQNIGDLDALEKELEALYNELDSDDDDDDSFIETPDEDDDDDEEEDNDNTPEAEKTTSADKEKPFILRGLKFGNIDFPYKNILLKGVPGTGKSRLINHKFIKKLGFPKATHANILRINVHSASSNADLMQGIGISTANKQIEYHEKQGLILHQLEKAIAHPYQPFVIVLEEIQENNLNELIGDLIYLIEDEKRTDIAAAVAAETVEIDTEYESLDAFIGQLILENDTLHFVEVPYLVSTETKYRKLIVPNNLYFFCTSNYRDDKKIIEDNLLRRFDLIELYPNETAIQDESAQLFLKTLNISILKHFKESEIHPDRFMIGHATWLNVNNKETFCRAFLKAITEFKDIREIEFRNLEPILKDIKTLPFGLKTDDILRGSYKTIIDHLQQIAYGDLLNNND